MGSVGSVYTGNLLGAQVTDLIEGRVSTGDRDNPIPDIIRVYANNNDRISQFTINLTGATQEERQAFLTYWKGKSNIHDRNARNAYDNAFRQAKERIDPHTGTNISDEDARAIAEIRRADASYTAINNALEKDRNGKKAFGGITVAKTRNRRQ